MELLVFYSIHPIALAHPRLIFTTLILMFRRSPNT